MIDEVLDVSEKELQVFSKGNVPLSISGAAWRLYQKKVQTKALRIDGPFTVETSEGTLNCKDGFLCIDARGYPYPVAKDEFELIYEPSTEE